MSILNKKWTRALMAGLVVTGMAREGAFAQDADIPTLTPPVDVLEEANRETTTVDNIKNNILLYARTKVTLQKTADPSARKIHETMLTNSMMALQRALLEYRSFEENPTRFPEVKVTGLFDLKTAQTLLPIAREMRLNEIFFSPPLDAYDADILTGLSIFRNALKRIAPQEYMTALESIAGEIDQMRIMAEERAQVGMVMEFKQCALALQDEIPTAAQLSQEIKRVSTELGYVSQYVSEGCYGYTKELLMQSLRTAQLDFLHESPVMAEDRSVWCHRDVIEFDGPICRELKL